MRMHPVQLIVITGVVAATAGCSIEIHGNGGAATGTFERTLTVSGPVELDVRTGAGSVVVRRGGEEEAVRVTGQVRARAGLLGGRSADELVAEVEANPPIAQDGNAIRLGRPDGDLRHVSISYEVTVPAETRVRARTGSGRIEVESLQGPVEAHTGSGSIVVGRVARAVTAETGSGSIEVSGAGDGLSASTGSGSIRAWELAGAVRAESGSGRIDVTYAGEGDVNLRTGSGGIVVSGLRGGARVRTGSGGITVQGTPAAAWDLDAGSGSITLRLPAGASFELDVHARSGRVETSHPVAQSGRAERNTLRGAVRGGGPLIRASTGSGGIRID